MAKHHHAADQAQTRQAGPADGGLTRVRSVLSHPFFLPLVGSLFVLGQLADLLGTFVAQPHLEHEGNWLVMGLKSMGVQVGFKSAVAAKSVICALGIACLEFFAQRCRKYYPPRRLSGSAFVHYFIYGRTPDEPKGDLKSSRDVRAMLVLFAGFWALSGPLYMYMGYDNLAAHYGWFRVPGFFIGGVYSTWADVFLMLTTLGGLLFLLEGDHHAVMDATGRRTSGYDRKRLATDN